MNSLLIIFYSFCLSFIIMNILVAFAPEYIEDEDGHLVPKKKASIKKQVART